MAIQNGFFKSINGDRKYLAEFFTSYFASFIGNGVFPNPSTNLQVISNQNFSTIVRPGKGWINGHYLNNDENIVINHQPPDGVLRRIDRIVFSVNQDSRSMDIYLKQGIPSSVPTAPALIRNSTLYELALADIAFNPGMVSISQSNITDQRLNTNLCGIVHGVVDQVDTTTIFNQIQQSLDDFKNFQEADFLNWSAQRRQEFEDWYNTVQDILDGDVAANLLDRILELEQSVNEELEKIKSEEINVMNPPSPLIKPIGDGLVDDTNALNAISEYARDNNLGLFIPSNTYLINGTVTFYNNIRNEGTFVFNSNKNTNGIVIKGKKPVETINSGNLTNLVENSKRLGGLSNYKGHTLVLSSTEPFLNRNDPSGGTYDKHETFEILDSNGTLSSSLDFTYNNINSLTVLAYPPEEALTISGMNILVKNNGIGNFSPLSIERSNVKLYNLDAQPETENTPLNSLVRVFRASDVSFYNAKIKDLKDNGSSRGYGVSLTDTCNIYFNNCEITNCRHSVSGRWAKNVNFNGGIYSRIDSHWGVNFKLENLTIVTEQTESSAISYSGKDISINNVEASGSSLRFLLSIRNDAPELDGKINIDNVTIKTNSDFVRFVSNDTASTNFDYGRRIKNPRMVSIKNVIIDAPENAYIVILQAGTAGQRQYQQYNWGSIRIEDVEIINRNPLTVVYLGFSVANYVALTKTNIVIKNIKQVFGTTNNHNTLRLFDHTPLGASPNDLKIDVYAENCGTIKTEINPSSVSSVIFNNCEIKELTKGTVGSTSDSINSNLVQFKGCLFTAADIRNGKSNIYINCGFQGANTLTLNLTKLTKANYAFLGATGYPQLDGLIDDIVFITN